MKIIAITGKKIVYVRVLAFIKNRLRCKIAREQKITSDAAAYYGTVQAAGAAKGKFLFS